MSDWWLGVGPAEARVSCGGASHRVRWEAGALRLLDHDDPEGERTLAALGGEACACIELLDAWERHATDKRVLVAASRGPADRVERREWREPEASRGGWMAYPGMEEEPRDPLLRLLSLPGALPDRLVATVVAGCSPRRITPRMHAALYGRVRSALGVELDLEVAATPSAYRDDAGVHVALPFSWLLEVWARGLATIAGRFCLAAHTEDGRRYALTVVDAGFGAPREVRLEL